MEIEIDSIESLKEISNQEFNVAEINSIKVLFGDIRDDSKAPTFLLTFGGSWIGLMKNCGFSEEESKRIEANYHKLYVESDEWVRLKLEEACKTGYVQLAFGLRLRTPLLHKSILGNSSTLYQAEKEARTAGNALSGQSYGLLNNRAVIAFMKKVWASKWRLDIKPVALIHDAIYLVIKDDIECLKWVNDNLITEMEWQDLPELRHDNVKLKANLEVFYKGWHQPIELPNYVSQQELLKVCVQEANKYDIVSKKGNKE